MTDAFKAYDPAYFDWKLLIEQIPKAVVQVMVPERLLSGLKARVINTPSIVSPTPSLRKSLSCADIFSPDKEP